jgi:hypothetical protein
MSFHIRPADFASAPLRIPLAILSAFVVLIGILLANRHELIAGMFHTAMKLM